MSRDPSALLQDILEAADRIQAYLSDVDEQYFESSTLLQDAVSRNLEVIGEAAKKLPGEIRQSIDTVEWRKIAGMRDIIAHEYFGLDLNIVWDACTRKIPELSGQIRSWLEAQ